MSINMKNYSAGVNDYEIPAAVESEPLNTYQAVTQLEEFPMPVIPEEVEQEVAEAPPVQQAPESDKEKNFRALSDKVEKLQAERDADRKEFEMQLHMLRANSVAKPQSNEEKPKSMFEGMGDTEIPNVSEIRKEWSLREQQYQAQIEELQVAQYHPDYAEVVERFAAPLLKEKPSLLNAVLASQNKALTLYEIGKLAQQTKQLQEKVSASAPPPTQGTPPSSIAQKIVENSKKPGTLSSMGGQSTLSKADYFASMSDADFMKMASKNLGEL